jgi:glucosamine--fructose-6-phosphate aminotransferase (isomerizing)
MLRKTDSPQHLIMPAGPRRPFMLKEIHAAPDRVEALLREEARPLAKAVEGLRREHPPLIFIAGRGTSDNAATYGRYLFEHFLGIPVSGAALSLFTLYPTSLHLTGALAIGISQSGESPDVVKALRTAKKLGAFTLAVTNAPESSLARLTHHTVQLHALRERAVAATKTYTAELVAMAMICQALGGGVPESEIRAIPESIRAALECEQAIAEVAPRYRYAPRCVCLARGFNYATARETALKLMETCHLGSTGMSAADFLHGPIAFVEPATPVLLYAADGPTYPFMSRLAQRLKREQVAVLTMTNKPAIARHSAITVHCPVEAREGLTPIPFATLGQLFACYLALERGLNPDAPRGLRKVTRTL